MAHDVRLLGLVPGEGAAFLAQRLGDDVRAWDLGGIAALVQPAKASVRRLFLKRDRAGLLKVLAAVQRRLEAACQAAPLLACDPGAAICPEPELRALLAAAEPDLADALARFGRRHQWDVVLRWQPEAVLAARRDEVALIAGDRGRAGLAEAVAEVLKREVADRTRALHDALRSRVIAIAEAIPAAGDAETGATVLVPSGGEAAIEQALSALPPAAQANASCDLRGPLPPLALGALRIASTDRHAVDAAWKLLGLPPRLEARELTQRWRSIAADLHPDRQGPQSSADAMAEAGAAYRLLRQAATRQPSGLLDLAAMQARPGRYLAMPAEAA